MPIAAGAGVFLFLFALLPPTKIPLWVVNLSGASAEDTAAAHGGLQLSFRVDYDFETDPDEAIDQVIEVIRRRVDARGFDEPNVYRRGELIVVELPGVAQSESPRLQDMLSRRGVLEFRIVQHDSAAMRAVPMRAEYQGLEVMIDRWNTPAGGEYRDRYLIAPDRETLERVMATLADDEVFFGYEHVTSSDYGASRPEGAAADYWRSYALRRSPYLGSDAIDDASVTFDQMTNQPQVMVQFTDAGADQFAQLTEQYAGYKLAIVLDDEIRSAPVIQERIAGGRAVVNMGADKDPATLEARARDLAAVFESGSLRSPVVLEDERVIAAGLTEAGMWTSRALFGLMIGLLVAAAAFGAQLLAARFRPANG